MINCICFFLLFLSVFALLFIFGQLSKDCIEGKGHENAPFWMVIIMIVASVTILTTIEILIK